MIRPGYYSLDRIENETAVLQQLQTDTPAVVLVPAADLGGVRPADGTVFVFSTAEGWREAPDCTAQRRAALQRKMTRLLNKNDTSAACAATHNQKNEGC